MKENKSIATISEAFKWWDGLSLWDKILKLDLEGEKLDWKKIKQEKIIELWEKDKASKQQH